LQFVVRQTLRADLMQNPLKLRGELFAGRHRFTNANKGGLCVRPIVKGGGSVGKATTSDAVMSE
jgi:hypothetical protein